MGAYKLRLALTKNFVMLGRQAIITIIIIIMAVIHNFWNKSSISSKYICFILTTHTKIIVTAKTLTPS